MESIPYVKHCHRKYNIYDLAVPTTVLRVSPWVSDQNVCIYLLSYLNVTFHLK